MSDIKLISQISARIEPARDVILLNIPGQKYTFGSVYPGERNKEEFIFCRYRNYAKPIHCFITVDESGKFWIENATETSNTYVNKQELKKKRILEVGDNFSFGVCKTLTDGSILGPVYVVEERRTINILPPLEIFWAPEDKRLPHFSPGDNNLVLSKILSYMDFPSLKMYRFVASTWNLEASKLLEKRGKVVLKLESYIEPMTSTQIFRFLHEVKHLNFRQINIILPQTIPPNYYVMEGYKEIISSKSLKTCPGEPGEKLIQDIKKLANSGREFKILCVEQQIKSGTDFEMLKELLQNLGNNLDSLILSMLVWYKIPTEEISKIGMNSLKRFEHNYSAFNSNEKYYEPLAVNFVPLIPQNVKELFCSGNLHELFLKECLVTPRLNMLSVKNISLSSIPFLIQEIKFPLTKLELTEVPVFTKQEELDDFSQLFEKLANTLEYLKVEMDSNKVLEIKFPSFTKLKGLSVKYGHKMRIWWEVGRNRVDYFKDFPVLEKLDFQPIIRRVKGDNEKDVNLPFEWENEEDLFNSFFDYYSEAVCVTLRTFEIAVPEIPIEKRNDFVRRVMKFREIFPAAERFPWERNL